MPVEEVIALPVLLDILSRGGVLTVTVMIIWALVTDRVVTRGRLRQVEAERDREHADCAAEKQQMIEAFEAERQRERYRTEAIIRDRDRLRTQLEQGGRHRGNRWL